VPPLTGVAVKVTAVPEQIVVAEAEMDTSVATVGVTVIVMLLLAATTPFTQGELLVSVKLITSLFVNAALLYVALFVPTGEPLSIHW